VDVHADLIAPCSTDRLFSWVDDLETYPRWMRLAHRVDREVPASGAIDSSASGAGDGPAWLVELRARVGPMARSKRLRMVRSERIDGHRVVFSRDEMDGRSHAAWVLTAEVEPHADGSRLHVHLHYGGGLWTGGLMERVLTEEITRGREALSALVAESPSG
jgi:hypothetical protein